MAAGRFMKDGIYAFIFGQKGLMAGLGLQGNKISKINPKSPTDTGRGRKI